MPTYEYECTKGHHFEVEQSINDEALKRCKVCRAKAQRLISRSSFILKGSGWYSDGYGSSKKSSSDSSSESKSESKSEPKSETKSDSKPAKSSDSSKGSKSKSGAGSAAAAGS